MRDFNRPESEESNRMKTITEITPTENRVYTMPDEICCAIRLAVNMRWHSSVSKAVASLPNRVQPLVTLEVLPHEPVLRGHSASIRIDDEPNAKFFIAIADEPPATPTNHV